MRPGFLIPRSSVKSLALVCPMEGATSGTPSLLLFVGAFASNTGLFNPVLNERFVVQMSCINTRPLDRCSEDIVAWLPVRA